MIYRARWQCPQCLHLEESCYDKCWSCLAPRPTAHQPFQQPSTGGLDDDNDNKTKEFTENEEIRVRVINEIFSLNLKMIQISPLLCKLHNDDMKKFVAMERLLYELIPNIFTLHMPKEITQIISEMAVAHIPTLQQNIIDISTFKEIVKYLEYHKENAVSRFILPLTDSEDHITKVVDDPFDINVVDKCDSFELLNLVSATNYLGIIPLFQLVCLKIAISNKGKPKAYLVNRFGQQPADWICKATPNEWWID
eukprot:246433_1